MSCLGQKQTLRGFFICAINSNARWRRLDALRYVGFGPILLQKAVETGREA